MSGLRVSIADTNMCHGVKSKIILHKWLLLPEYVHISMGCRTLTCICKILIVAATLDVKKMSSIDPVDNR